VIRHGESFCFSRLHGKMQVFQKLGNVVSLAIKKIKKSKLDYKIVDLIYERVFFIRIQKLGLYHKNTATQKHKLGR